MTHPAPDLPAARTATVHILQTGYAREDDTGQHVGSTVSLIVDGDALVVVDPGMVSSRAALLDVIAALDVAPDAVTDIVFSHHHPDHTINAALFPAARIHDHWATYEGDLWIDRPADGFVVSPSVLLIATPGHTVEDISTVVGTSDEIVVLTHAWWAADGPHEDPFAPDQDVLEASRRRILAVADRIVPGHGAPFVPDR